MGNLKRLLIIFSVLVLIAAGMVFCVRELLEMPPPNYEAQAISTLRTIESAQEVYCARYDKYATLKDLGELKLIDQKLASGERDGFYFDIDNSGSESWSAVAWPVRPSETVARSYYISKDGTIHYRKYTSSKNPLAGSNSQELKNR